MSNSTTQFARAFAAAVKYAVESPWQNLLGQLQGPKQHLRWDRSPEAAELRAVAADAYEDHHGSDDDVAERAGLIRDHNQHIVFVDGKPVRGRFTDRHIQSALDAVTDHLHEWSGGRWEPIGAVDWHDVSGVRHRDVDLLDHEQDESDFPEPNYRHPYGTLHVTHSPNDVYSPNYNHFIQYNDLGEHLAHTLEEDVNGGDYGWNTDGNDSYELNHDTLSTLRALRRQGHIRNSPGEYVTHYEAGQLLDELANIDTQRAEEAHGVPESSVEDAAQELREAREHLSEHQQNHSDHFDRLLHNLRTAPYEEPDPTPPKKRKK